MIFNFPQLFRLEPDHGEEQHCGFDQKNGCENK